jgi:hypothetical protein
VAKDNIVNSITDPILNSLTHVITPKGSLIVVAPGTDCPSGTAPQTFAANQAPQDAPTLPQSFASRSSAAKALEPAKGEVAGATLPAGSYLVNATAVISDHGAVSFTQTVKCVLVGADGQAIPGTTVTATIPPDTATSRLTLPISAAVTDLPPGNLALDCKSSVPAASGKSARIAAAQSPPASTGSIQATQTSSEGPNTGPYAVGKNFHGCPGYNYCVWQGTNYTGAMTKVQVDSSTSQSACREFDGYRSIVNNTDKHIYTYHQKGLSSCGNRAMDAQGDVLPNGSFYRAQSSGDVGSGPEDNHGFSSVGVQIDESGPTGGGFGGGH